MEKATIFVAMLLFFLAVVAVVDIKALRIPNFLIFPILTIGVISDIVLKRSDYIQRIIFAICVFVILFLIAHFTKGLGLGDVKLCTVVSYILGFKSFVISLFIACILGITTFLCMRYMRKVEIKKLPFAPFLSIAVAGCKIIGGCKL